MLLSILFALSPVLLHAKSECSKSFSVSSKKAEITAGFQSIKITTAGQLLIVLNDGSRWEVKDPKDQSRLEQLIRNEWKPGDDIRIGEADSDGCSGEYLLKNVRTKHTYNVDLDKNVEEGSSPLKITQIDESGYAIITSDGRQWAIGYFGADATSKWRVGDILFANKSDHDNKADYELINLRNRDTAWASIIHWQ